MTCWAASPHACRVVCPAVASWKHHRGAITFEPLLVGCTYLHGKLWGKTWCTVSMLSNALGNFRVAVNMSHTWRSAQPWGSIAQPCPCRQCIHTWSCSLLWGGAQLHHAMLPDSITFGWH